MNKNLLITLVVCGMLAHFDTIAMLGEKESKRRASKKEASTFEREPLTVTAPDRAQFSFKGKKVGPFDFKGIKPSDSGAILAKKKTDFSNIAVGVVHREKQDDNQLFALKFDKDWKDPEILFQSVLKGFDVKSGSELVKLTDKAIIVAGANPDRNAIIVTGVDFAGKEFEGAAEELGRPDEQIEVDKIINITAEQFTMEEASERHMGYPFIRVHIIYALANGDQRSTDLNLLQRD